jgi:hypothetical protein
MSKELRARLHAALDTFLDALDAYRAAPPEEDFVKLSDVALPARTKARLAREGHLPVVRIGKSLYTRRSSVARLVDVLPPAHRPEEEADDLMKAARRRSLRPGRTP